MSWNQLAANTIPTWQKADSLHLLPVYLSTSLLGDAIVAKVEMQSLLALGQGVMELTKWED